MCKNILSVTLTIFLILTAAAFAVAQNAPPKAGSALPEIELLKPGDSTHLKYLGLPSGGTSFKVHQIKAKVAIIQIFSMYCPYCQADAPNVNRLYGLIENNPQFKDKIKIIGIGVGNSQFEVGIFKKKYSVEFPLVPDGDFKIHKIVGEVRTPYFIVVKLDGSKSPPVIYAKQGAHENIEAFLAQIVKLADLK
jgi:thiol-disulfide isomerase/thioredoxin